MHSVRFLFFVLFLIFSLATTTSNSEADNHNEDVMTPTQSSTKTSQEVSHPFLGYSCTIPEGWVYKQTAEGTILGHNSIPGMIVVSSHMQPDLLHLRTELSQGIRENDISLSLSGTLQNVTQNIISGDYQGTLGDQEVMAKGFGILSGNGGGTYVLALGLPGEFSNSLADTAATIATSMRFVPARPDNNSSNPLVGKWKDIRGGGHTIITLAEDGTFTYYSDYSSSGVGWGYANSDESKGHWQSSGTKQTGILFYQTRAGEQGSMPYQVLIENGQIYWNEYNFNGTLYLRQ